MKNGFTLIELLAGIGIFSLVLGTVIGIFASAISFQRRILIEQQTLDQLSFAIEYLSRSLRMAKRDEGQGCLSSSDLNYENPYGISSIRFINVLQENDCQEFFLEEKRLKYKKGGEIFDLVSPDIEIESLNFQLSGQSQTDNLQPKVTIFLRAKPSNFPSMIELQTTISQRNLDI